MPYGTDTDPYLDPVTGVLKNSLGITDADELERAEADITSELIASLIEHPVVGDFDFAHLRDVHKKLFSSLYPWAGELRTVEMTKGETRFANPEFLDQAAKNVFDDLRQERLLSDLPENEYASRLAHYYSEVNILHPFREGNGRTQRAFFTLLALESGKRLAWELMDAKENLTASISAYNGDETK